VAESIGIRWRIASEYAIEAYKLCNRRYDVYCGVIPRVGRNGKRENIHWVSAFHASIDYGILGHKHLPDYLTDDQARDSIKGIPLLPSIIIHSGGGYHYYWVLNTPIYIADFGTDLIERINRDIVWFLGGKTGTEITSFLRIPGTYNFKDQNMLREVELDYLGQKYDYKDIFEAFG